MNTETAGDYDIAMRITEQVDADAFFEHLVQEQIAAGLTREKAEEIERSNLGYWAGYYNDETRARVERMFCCAHPIFGAIAEKGSPTIEEALQAGIVLGKASK